MRRFLPRLRGAATLSIVLGGVLAALLVVPQAADASVSGGDKIAWTYVSSKQPRKSNWNSSDDAPVGNGVGHAGTFRSFFRMDVSKVSGKHVLAAVFRAYQNSGPCEPDVELWVTGEITSATTWNHQPQWLRRLNAATASDQFGACRFGWSVKDLVVEAAARGDRYLTFGLRAVDETCPAEPHVFESDIAVDPYFGTTVSPWLNIEFNTAPDVPSQLGFNPGTGCTGTPPTGDGRYARTLTPVLSARFTDADDSVQQVRGHFQWAVAGGAALGEAVSVFRNVGSRQCAAVPAGQLVEGGTYAWRVRAEDRYQPPGEIEFLSDMGEWSAWQEFKVDLTPPAQPVVSSTVYPENALGAWVGTPGEFVFTPNGSTDVAVYRYATGWDGLTGTVTAGADGTATVTVTPTGGGDQTLRVWSVDRAGFSGPQRIYAFTVDQNPEPSVSSAVYPADGPGGGAGVPGEFTFSAGGGRGVVAYRYQFDFGTEVELPAGENGTARATLTPETAGAHVLSVVSVDGAGYASPAHTYYFSVDPGPASEDPGSA
ncbi:hypothetical protein [Sphaerisporangium corydalis]|uniref:DNRLRE domain-containing protein n=1 Tax=Sphaerisporangium corydalis TaxID=1441875 RepID=A0ABV9EAR4_9ACTN|nr:hypothetical protein [Sphaerisporangium corydalis]